jgi:intein/homing endonuclease
MSAYATSAGGWGIKALVVGLIAKKVFVERMLSRKIEEIESIRTGYSYFKIKEETNEEKKPLVWFVLDECLTSDTIINTSSGKQKLIDIVNNNLLIEISSYNPLTHNLEYKSITKIYKKGKKKVIELETETGKRIKCTEEHQIKTINGFQKANIAQEISTPLETQYLKNKDFIIARLFGSIIGDGYLNLKGTVVGFSGKGSDEDLMKIKADLQELGFSSSKIQTRQTKSLITTTDGKTHEVKGISQECTSSTKCHAFFKEKGAPIGKKILSKFQIPKWLMESDKQIKAEFLSALFGADGTAPSISKACKRDFNPIRLSFNYLIQNEESALNYAKDLIKILKDLDIKGDKITFRKGNIRKDGNQTKKILITLSKETSNTIRFLETIGYKYCRGKEIRAKKWLMYLKAKQYEKEKTLKLKEEAIVLHQTNNIGKRTIAKKLNVKDYQVREWIYYDHKTRTANSFPNFEDWTKKRIFENQVFEQITKKTELASEEVFDISVKDNNTFIANDFIVHNCHELLPREGKTAATDALVTILREGRQPGISLLLITQQPGKIHSDVLTQADIVLAHRLTAKLDVEAFNSMMQSYLGDTLTSYLNILPADSGAAIILDDNSERLYPIQVRPKVSWHGGESPTAIKFERSQNLGI